MFRKLTASVLLFALFASEASAAKIYQLVNATVYYSNGSTAEYADSLRMSMPRNKDKLQPVENAYTKKQKKGQEIDVVGIDSVVVNLPTSPMRRHCFVYLPEVGWSALLAKSSRSNAYMHASDGYRLRCDGGLWFYDTRKLIVEQDGQRRVIKNPQKMSVEKFAEKIAEISGGDAVVEERLKSLMGKVYKDNYVQIVKMNGDTIRGYLHNDVKTVAKNLFSKSGSLLQYINFSEEPDGKCTRYSADDVSEISWFNSMQTSAPNLRLSTPMNAPRMFKWKNYTRGFTWLWDRRPGGCIVKWECWSTTGGKNPVSRLVPAVSVYFTGTKGAFMLYSNGSLSFALLYHYMKEVAPGFHEMLEQYYGKGPDASAHCRELKDNPSTILALYEEYLKTNPPINDPADVVVKDEDADKDK